MVIAPCTGGKVTCYFIDWRTRSGNPQDISFQMQTPFGLITDTAFETTFLQVNAACGPNQNGDCSQLSPGYALSPTFTILNDVFAVYVSQYIYPTIRYAAWSDNGYLGRRAANTFELPAPTSFNDPFVPVQSRVPIVQLRNAVINGQQRIGVMTYIGSPQGYSRIADLYWECQPCV